MKKAFAWLGIAALLVLVVRIVLAQTPEVSNSCSPAMVEWTADSLAVQSFGCVDFRTDSLLVIGHLVNGHAQGVTVIQKKDIKHITLLKEAQTATLRGS